MSISTDAKQQQSSTSTTEKTETKGRDGAVVTTTTKGKNVINHSRHTTSYCIRHFGLAT